MMNTELKNVFVKTLGISDQLSEDQINQAGLPEWDSLTHVKLIMAIEKQFGIEFDIDDFEKLNSFESIFKVIELKKK